MTREEIRAFLTIVQCKSISSAAEKLYISQPALSTRIKNLEDSLGYKLLCRKKGSRITDLTEEGIAFLPLAKMSDQLWKEAVSIPKRTKKDSFRVLTISSVTDYIMPDVIPAFLDACPQVDLQFLMSHSEESYRLLESGSVDLAVVSPEIFSSRVLQFPAYRSEMVCISDSRQPLPDVVTPDMLAASQEIRVPWSPEYDSWHEKYFPIAARPHVTLDSMRNLEALVNGARWAFVPSLFLPKLRARGCDVKVSHIEPAPPEQRVFVIVRDGELNEVSKVFLRCMHRAIQDAPDTVSYLELLG